MDVLINARASVNSQLRRVRQQVFGHSDDEEGTTNSSNNGILTPSYLYVQRYVGARNMKYVFFTLLIFFLCGYTAFFQSYETGLYQREQQQILHNKQGNNKPSPSGSNNNVYIPPSAVKTGNIRGSPSTGRNSSSSGIIIIGGGNSTSSTGSHFVDRTAEKHETSNSFWLSLFLSIATWVVVLQIIRYIQRVARSRSISNMDRTTQIQMVSQLARYTRNPGIARRLQLALLNRDFTPDDYEALQQLDDERFGGTGSSGARRPATEASIQRLPTHIVTEADVQHGELGSCNICLAAYEAGDEVRTIQCMHKFHSHCVDRWLRSNGVCPICKYPATDELSQ